MPPAPLKVKERYGLISTVTTVLVAGQKGLSFLDAREKHKIDRPKRHLPKAPRKGEAKDG